LNKNFDLTPWIEWHLNTLNDAMKQSLINIEYFIQKTKFWDKHRSKALNERQLKVLNPDYAIGKFQSKQTYYKI